MEFSEEQQRVIDGLINKRVAEVKSKAEARAAEQVAEAEAKHVEESNTLKSELAKLKDREGENKERIRQALLKAEVSQLNVVKAEQVMKLVDESFVISEDGKLEVIDAEGKAKFDAEGKPMTARTFIEGFLADNLHLQKASRLTGSGSSSAMSFSGAAKTMRRTEFNDLSASQRTDYIQSGGRLKE